MVVPKETKWTRKKKKKGKEWSNRKRGGGEEGKEKKRMITMISIEWNLESLRRTNLDEAQLELNLSEFLGFSN